MDGLMAGTEVEHDQTSDYVNPGKTSVELEVEQLARKPVPLHVAHM